MSLGRIGGVAAGVGLAMALGGAAAAQTCTSYPNNLQNGAPADASQVMADFNCAALTGAGRFTGNVGIGTTTPGFPLVVASSALNVKAQLTGTTSQNGLLFDGAGGGDQFYLYSFASGFSIWNNSDARNDLSIDNSGNVGVGMQSGQISKLHVVGDLNLDISAAQRTIYFRDTSSQDGMAISSVLTGNRGLTVHGAGGGNVVSAYFDRQGSVGIGTTSPSYLFYVNGTAGGTSNWTVASDARLKKNVEQIGHALDIVRQLRGVRFAWRSDAERTVGRSLTLPAGKTEIGVVAQEVARVLPEAVATPQGPDGYYGVQEAGLVAVLIEGMKEQQAQIARLQRRLSVLERGKRR